MKKIYIVWLSLFIIAIHTAKADEGMWLPTMINQLGIGTLTEMGLELTAEDIYSVNQSSLKDAIVALDYGSCTAELVSKKGLILTNHHCAFGEIQEHSTTENDYITDGFWAMTMKEELPNPGKTATLLIRMEDVTDRVMADITDDMSDRERNQKIEEISQVIVEEARADTHYDARIDQLYMGNRFYLFVYETFRDVRLVGAPPSTIGKFGGDVDNWMWPRHTGDFSIYRIYTGPDGKPADYSEENIPYEPKHVLPISLDGIEEGDFAMVFGFPGSTSRYLTSYGVKNLVEIINPVRIKVRTKKLELIKEDMDQSDKVRIQYASKYQNSSNYWKNSIGQNKSLKRLKIYDKKQDHENAFMKWVNADDERKAKYGNTLKLIQDYYESNMEANKAIRYFYEAVYGGGEIILFASRLRPLYNAMNDSAPDQSVIDAQIANFRSRMDNFYKDYNAPTDKKVTKALVKMFYEDVDPQYHPTVFKTIEKKYKGNFDKFFDKMFDKSIFVDPAELEDFLDDPKSKVLEKDMVFTTMLSFLQKLGVVFQETQMAYNERQKGERLFMAGLMEMNPDKVYYPDANSTLRLTYGKVCDYYPADAVHYNYYTTLKGVMEKDDPSGENFFDVPEKLEEIYKNKDYGLYGEGEVMKVCFTTDNDITGGNSGSPVLNGKGQLIGIAFDGNWEAMSSDITFEPELQRCINVDIRYVLLIIDKFAGATHLVDEMTLVSSKEEEKIPAESDVPPGDPVEEMVE